MQAHEMITRSVKEPAYREGDGIEVSLLWDDGDDWLTVSLRDARTGMLFEVDAAHDRALDVFYHPFSYATSRTVRGVDELRAAGFGG